MDVCWWWKKSFEVKNGEVKSFFRSAGHQKMRLRDAILSPGIMPLDILKDALKLTSFFSGYCARRVRRIRKSLGFTHIHKGVPKHPAKFIHRKLTFDIVIEERYYFLYAIIKRSVSFPFTFTLQKHTDGKLRELTKWLFLFRS